METKTKSLILSALALFVLIFVSGVGSAALLANWPLNTTHNGVPTNVYANVNAGNFLAGSGLSDFEFGLSGAFAKNWPTSDSPDAAKYFQITISPQANYKLTINTINFWAYRSPTGPANYKVQWSKNSDFSSPTTIVTRDLPADTEVTGDISGQNILINNGETLIIRWFGYNATGSTGTFRINDNTLSIEGIVENVPSPSLNLASIRALTKTQNGILNLTNTGNVPINSIQMTQSGFVVTLTPSSISSLAPGSSQLVDVTSTFENLNFGGNDVTIKANGTAGTTTVTSNSITYTIPKTFCNSGEKGGNLTITDVNINNVGEGDDNEWRLLDRIEVEVDVENKGNEDIRDITVELGFFDSLGRNQIKDLDFESGDDKKIDIGRLNDGDSETVTFNFRVPANIEIGNYKFGVKVYSKDLGEDRECSSTSTSLGQDNLFEKIEIKSEDEEGKFIAFENIQVTPSEATCGDRVLLTANVYNIGDEEQDQVKITLSNTDLGITKEVEIRKNLDVGDKEAVSFDFEIPKNAQNKVYTFKLNAAYDYRGGSYREYLDELVNVLLKVIGCTAENETTGEGNIAAINAVLQSEAKPGQELIVKTIITNLKNKKSEFILDVRDYDSWASLEEISDRIINLDAGQSKDITLKFKVNKDAEGEKSFVVGVLSEGRTEDREIAVNIAKPSTGGFNFGSLGENSFLWIIGAINVILIVIIIIVAVRISKR